MGTTTLAPGTCGGKLDWGCVSESQCKCKRDNADACIPKDWICDYEADCDDGADEAGCPSTTTTTTTTSTLAPGTCGGKLDYCAPWDNYCTCKTPADNGNNKCISEAWVCDGEDDCGDNSDEEGCPSNA